MPTPVAAMIIGVTSSTATISGEGEIKIINITRSQFIKSVWNGSKESNINPKDTYPGWVSGDEIQVEVNGRITGVGTGTLTAKGVKISVTTTVATVSAAKNYSVNM